MPIETEADLWTAVLAVAQPRDWFTERFEDPASKGKPDAYIGAGPHRCWIEMKVKRIRYRMGQEAWALRASQKGERAMTLLHANGQFLVFDTAQRAMFTLGLADDPAPVYEGPDLLSALLTALGKPQTAEQAEQAAPKTTRAGRTPTAPEVARAKT